MPTESPATKEGLSPPNFTFSADKPVEDTNGLSEYNYPWAIVERLDYIAQALYLLVEGNDGPSRS